MNVLANENCAETCPGTYTTAGRDSNSCHCRLAPRFAFVVSASAALLLLRYVDPVVAGSWLPFHLSCGAITGLPCIFCGMTRALHLLLNGNFIRAIYFNWLAFPFAGAIVFLLALFAIEIAKRRVILRLNVIFPMTRWRLTVFGLSLFLLWTLQTYLAISQPKYELLNPHGPLYAVFVR